MAERILIVEDEPRLVSFLEKGLRAAGFTTSVAADGATALAKASPEDFDLIVLDLGLPDLDGMDVLTELRSRGVALPVVILTARDDLDDKVRGLDRGADDYLTKPFRFEELLARVRARLRDSGGGPAEPRLEADGVVLDLHTRLASVGERSVDLSSREFALLETFMRHRGQVLSREQLLSRVWGYDHDPGSNVIDVYVGYLRRKIGADYFHTIRGAGYRFGL